MLPEPFKKAQPIIENIEQHHFKAYFVGGCVRDYLLERDIGDIDIATSASPEEIQRIFPKVIPVGIAHGTVIVRHEHESYEVTTFRIDGDYSDQRHPDSVEFINRIDEDLKRRDFTINALAMDKNGRIIDLFESRKDLDGKLIRTVGDAIERFEEDPLRIIRALRFTSRLGFKIHPETKEAMTRVKPSIQSLAAERIQNEIAKFFSGKFINEGLEYLKETGVYTELPIFKEHHRLVYQLPHPMLPLFSFGEIIALMHFLEDRVSITNWVKQWKCSNQMKEEALQLYSAVTEYKTCGLHPWLVYKLKDAYFNGFVRLVHCLQIDDKLSIQEVTSISENLPIQSKQDIAFNGHDLIRLFPKLDKGPWMQETLHKVEKAIVTGKITNYNGKIKEWLKWNPPEIN